MKNRTGADVRMTDRHDGTETEELNFGPFRLTVVGKKQLREGKPVRIGQRALDVLITLARRPGEVIERTELLSTVWQGTHVDERNLRAQIVAVRKALGDGINGARYVISVTGRGYSFVAAMANGPSGHVADRTGPAMRRSPTLPVRLCLHHRPRRLYRGHRRSPSVQSARDCGGTWWNWEDDGCRLGRTAKFASDLAAPSTTRDKDAKIIGPPSARFLAPVAIRRQRTGRRDQSQRAIGWFARSGSRCITWRSGSGAGLSGPGDRPGAPESAGTVHTAAATRSTQGLHAVVANPPCKGICGGQSSKKLGVDDLAAAAKLSVSRLCKVFRRSFGKSPHAYLITRRMARARTLMLESDISLAEIAFECGLADQAHFNRLFRQRVGITPGTWRRMRRQRAPQGDNVRAIRPPAPAGTSVSSAQYRPGENGS